VKRVVASVLGTVAGLIALLNFKTHPAAVALPQAATAGTGTTGTAGDSGAAGSAPSAASPSSTSPGSAAGSSGSSGGGASSATGGGSTGTKTVTGDSVDTRWGPVQVRITVTNGKVTKSEAVNYPLNTGRDQEINSYAIPALNQEAVAAGSAKIDMISGATYTSQGYIGSLQSALSKAGL
jgi:major membrane immunogen (membrane-anchored lipoprotein)